MNFDELCIQRSFELANLGSGSVSPNPMVGAVLVYQNKVIGEGYHQVYGGAHAEVNALNDVALKYKNLIAQSCLYVSLEPCCIFGKTPPCTNLILKNKIPRVVISCLDQTPGVNGKSIRILREAGVEVITGVLEEKGRQISKIRQTFTSQNRPYIILKFAQSSDGFIGKKGEQVWISNILTKRLVHKWRSEVDAILIGTNTALTDNPRLTNRLYFGKSPIRMVIDRSGRLPNSLHLFDQSTPTFVITEAIKNKNAIPSIQLPFEKDLLQNLLRHLHQQNISSLLVEGGARLLNSFIKQNLWDEARVLESNTALSNGIKAPTLAQAPSQCSPLSDNKLKLYLNKSPN